MSTITCITVKVYWDALNFFCLQWRLKIQNHLCTSPDLYVCNLCLTIEYFKQNNGFCRLKHTCNIPRIPSKHDDDHPVECESSLGFFLHWEFFSFQVTVATCCTGGFSWFYKLIIQAILTGPSYHHQRRRLPVKFYKGEIKQQEGKHCCPIRKRSLWKTARMTSQFIGNLNLETLFWTASFRERNSTTKTHTYIYICIGNIGHFIFRTNNSIQEFQWFIY